jgi:cobalt-zinc-cadmium efflux system outer membrane protein
VAAATRESVAGTNDVFLVGRQDLPISGRRRHLITAGLLAAEAAEAEATFQIRRLQADVRRAFVALLAAQERESILDGAAGSLRALIAVLQAREEAGEGSRYDRLRGQRALADLESERAAAAIARARARADVAAFLGPGVTPDGLVAAGSWRQDPPRSLERLIAETLAARGDYQATEQAAARFDAERQAANALRIPTPSVTWGMKRSTAGATTHYGSQLTFEVAVPLFNRGQAAAALASAQALRADAERAFLRGLVEAEVRAAHAAVILERARAVEYEQALVNTAEPLSAIARVAYEEGELGILELLDANRQLTAARLHVLELAAAGRLAAIELDRVTGVEIKP